jgi:alcohol dehydrogenase (cytochrome c)
MRLPAICALGLALAGGLWGQPIASALGAGQATITGAWRSVTPSWWTSGWTVVLEADGGTVRGAVTNCPRAGAVEIFDGRVEGDTVTFKCRSEDGQSTLAFTGRLAGDEIRFTWDLQGRPADGAADQPDPPQITVERVSDTVGEMVRARIAERVRTTRPSFSPVTFDRILRADREPQNWLTYSGSMLGHRHSLLTQITPENVAALDLAWIWPSQSTGRFEATPIVAEGVLYTVQAPNDVVALDAISGEVLWTFPYAPRPGARATGGGGRPNRGLAMLGDRLFLGTLDAHLLAIDARTGKLLWDTVVADAADPACKPPGRPQAPCYVITHAPMAVKDKVIVGAGGGDGPAAGYGIRGFVAAFDAATGREVWRFHTIPGPGEPGNDTWSGDSWKTGGAAVWNTGAYDPDLNLTYWGTGNPVPTYDGSSRLGDNLYANSVVALDADTGVLKWHYQFTPHDEKDWDSAQIPVLVDMTWQGRARQVMLWANRNGLMYVLDRTTGELLAGRPFVEINWMQGFDERGRPILSSIAKSDWIPSSLGGTNWHPPSYSPTTGLLYVSARERQGEGPGNAFGAVRALDPATGQRRWEFVRDDAWFSAGVLTTVSGLLFTGTTGDTYSGPVAAGRAARYFYALDARTGELLWQRSLAGSVYGSPIAYSAGGTQYVAVAAGDVLFAFALRQ